MADDAKGSSFGDFSAMLLQGVDPFPSLFNKKRALGPWSDKILYIESLVLSIPYRSLIDREA